MRHCSNHRCPHFIRIGSAAEYVDGISACSDCGATLDDGPAPERTTPPVTPALWRRLAVTLLAIPALLALPWFTLPGVDEAALGAYSGRGGLLERFNLPALRPPESVSVFALGISPLVSAAVIVELAAFVVPRWRALRWEPAGRRRLLQATLALTFVLTAFQGYGISRLLESVPELYTGSTPVVVLTLMAGTAILILAAGILGRHGLVDGFSWMLAFSAGWEAIERVPGRLVQQAKDHALSPFAVLLLLGVPVAVAVATVRVLGAHRSPRPSRAPAETEQQASPGAYREHPLAGLTPTLRLPSSGIAPLLLGGWLAGLPAQLFTLGMPGAGSLGSLFRPDSVAFVVLYCGLAAGLAALLARGLHVPRVIAERWARGAHRVQDREQIQEIVEEQVRTATRHSAAIVGAMALIAVGAVRWLGSPVSVVGVATLTAVSIDLVAAWRAWRRAGNLVPVWSEQDIDTADMIAQALDTAGIPALARGASHRTLLQVFGPYVPIVIMVPAERAEEAERVLAPLVGEQVSRPNAERRQPDN